MQNQVTYLQNFEKDVLHRNITRFYDDEEFLAVKKSVRTLRDEINYSGLYYKRKIFSKVLVQVQETQSFMQVPHVKRTYSGCSCGEDLRPGQQK